MNFTIVQAMNAVKNILSLLLLMLLLKKLIQHGVPERAIRS